MKKHPEIVVFVVVLLVVAAVIGLSWDVIKPKLSQMTGSNGGADNGGANGGSGSTTAGNSQAAAQIDLNKTLKKGVSGPEVKELQKALNQVQAQNPLVADGIFGANTEAKLYALTGKKEITLSQAYNMLLGLFQ